jgi:hypothetical protein
MGQLCFRCALPSIPPVTPFLKLKAQQDLYSIYSTGYLMSTLGGQGHTRTSLIIAKHYHDHMRQLAAAYPESGFIVPKLWGHLRAEIKFYEMKEKNEKREAERIAEMWFPSFKNELVHAVSAHRQRIPPDYVQQIEARIRRLKTERWSLKPPVEVSEEKHMSV